MSKVLIVGRMNVGKSTLFNRLAKDSRSITLDYEGVTRDFIKDKVVWNEKAFELIDCGGISLRRANDELQAKVIEKVMSLLESSDIILFMTDGILGLLPEDREIAKLLHKLGKPVILVVNKIDNQQSFENLYEFEKVGFKRTIGISAQHGLGINDLMDYIVDILPKDTANQEEIKPTLKVVLFGKPNVGKSSLMNLILKQERSIVSNIPGTTREAVSESIMFYKEAIEVTDTPGVRRQKSIRGELEPLMVKSAFAALKDSDILVLLIDGSESTLVDQELKLAFYGFSQQYKALILLINKHDLITELNKKEIEDNFDYYKHLINNIPVLQISCLSGKNVGKVLPLIQDVWIRYSQKFLNEKLQTLFITNLQRKPLYHVGQRLIIYSVEQIKTAPITILLKVNHPSWFGESQLGFFENLMRAEYDMKGVPVRFVVKNNTNNTKGDYE